MKNGEALNPKACLWALTCPNQILAEVFSRFHRLFAACLASVRQDGDGFRLLDSGVWAQLLGIPDF